MKLVIWDLALLACLAVRAAAFDVTESSEEVSERGLVTRLQIDSSAGRFAFVPPATWVMQIKRADEAICFEMEKLGALISVKFTTNAVPSGNQEILDYLEGRWPGAALQDRFAVFSRDIKGQAVECIYRSAAATRYRARVAFVPVGRGTVELTLTGPDDWPPVLHNSWVVVLNSLQEIPVKGSGPKNLQAVRPAPTL